MGPAIGSHRASRTPRDATPATGRKACLSGWRSLLRFGIAVVSLSLVLSLLAAPWIDLPWRTIFRRCVSIAAAASLWLCIRRWEGRSFRSYGLSAGGAGKRHFLFGLALGVGALGLLLGIGLASGACRLHVTPDHFKLWRTVLGFLPAALLVSVLEELVFRGFILQHLLACSKLTAVLVSSALYSVVHLKTTTFQLGTWLELGGLFLLGGVLAVVYLATNHLYLAMGLHAALAYGARVNKLLIEFPQSSLSWFVGTNRLVNGLAGWIVLLGIGGIAVWWARSSHGGGVHYGQA